MENSENPKGTRIINNLTALKFFEIATAILKNYALPACGRQAYYSLSSLFERNEFLEMLLSKPEKIKFAPFVTA